MGSGLTGILNDRGLTPISVGDHTVKVPENVAQKLRMEGFGAGRPITPDVVADHGVPVDFLLRQGVAPSEFYTHRNTALAYDPKVTEQLKF